MYLRLTAKPWALHVTLKLPQTKLIESAKMKYLGIIYYNKLNWKAHINELSKKLSCSVVLIYKINNFCKPPILWSLYFSLFNSHLSYGLDVCGNANSIDINKINLLQKRTVCGISGPTEDVDKFLYWVSQYKRDPFTRS